MPGQSMLIGVPGITPCSTPRRVDGAAADVVGAAWGAARDVVCGPGAMAGQRGATWPSTA